MQAITQELPTISLLVTIILAFAGWLITYRSARELARRKDELDLVNKRLNEFYGPLYVLSEAGGIAYKTLLRKLGRKDKVFIGTTTLAQLPKQEQEEWLNWVKHVFMPINEKREALIVNNAHLIREQEIPKCLLDFVTHVVGYHAILARWDVNDYSEHQSSLDYPVELNEYAARSYHELKVQQARLVGTTQGSNAGDENGSGTVGKP